jgi:hypothetical protein
VRREAERHGASIQPDHVTVKRWLDGVRPQGMTPQFIAGALGRQLGEPIRVSDIGMAYASEAPSAPFSDEGAHHAVEQASLLLTGDLAGDAAVRDAALDPRSWDGAIVQWLCAPTATARLKEDFAGHVTTNDVEELRATSEAFMRLDFRFGGGRARTSLVQYRREPAIQGRRGEDSVCFDLTALEWGDRVCPPSKPSVHPAVGAG